MEGFATKFLLGREKAVFGKFITQTWGVLEMMCDKAVGASRYHVVDIVIDK